jgi:hypothetical protein
MVAATLAGRRWGPRLGGSVAAFPAIVGPLLLVTVLQHGRDAASQAASGTVLGLVGLAAFAMTYGAMAHRHGWLSSLGVAWLAASLASGAVRLWALHLGLAGGTLIACASLLVATATVTRLIDAPGQPAPGRPGIAIRALITGLLVAGLSAAVSRLGAMTGGLLAALPVLASLLTVFTHREAGAPAALELLLGTLAGMAGFIAFCEIVALTIVGSGPLVAFSVATLAAILVQAPLAISRRAYPAARNSDGRSGEASASARLRPSASRSAA